MKKAFFTKSNSYANNTILTGADTTLVKANESKYKKSHFNDLTASFRSKMNIESIQNR